MFAKHSRNAEIKLIDVKERHIHVHSLDGIAALLSMLRSGLDRELYVIVSCSRARIART